MLWQNVLNSFFVGEYRGAFQQAPHACIVNYTVIVCMKTWSGPLKNKERHVCWSLACFCPPPPLYSWCLFPTCISLHSCIPPSAYFPYTSTFPGFSVQHILASLSAPPLFFFFVSFCFHMYLRCYVVVFCFFCFFPRYVFVLSKANGFKRLQINLKEMLFSWCPHGDFRYIRSCQSGIHWESQKWIRHSNLKWLMRLGSLLSVL